MVCLQACWGYYFAARKFAGEGTARPELRVITAIRKVRGVITKRGISSEWWPNQIFSILSRYVKLFRYISTCRAPAVPLLSHRPCAAWANPFLYFTNPQH